MSQGFGAVDLEIETALDEDAIRRVLDEVLVGAWKGRAVDEPGAWATYRTGSAAALRMWGVYSARGARRFPLIIRAAITGDRTRRLTLNIVGDEGPYLVYPARAQALWRTNIDRIRTALVAGLAPHSDHAPS